MRTFIIVGALVISWALKACQSARTITIEVVEALISIKYCNFNSKGSSCTVASVVSMVVVYWPA